MPNATRPMPNEINIPIIKEEKDMSWINKPQEIKRLNVNGCRITVRDEYDKNSEEVSLVVGDSNELYRTLLAIESNGIAKGYRKIGAENIYNNMIRDKSYAVEITFSPEDDVEFYLRNKDLISSNNYLWCKGHGMGGYMFSVKKCTGYGATKFKQSDLKHIPKGILDRCEREYVESEDK